MRSNRGGIYLVERTGPLAAAPLDFNAIGRWLEHCPVLTLDESRPTGRDLAAGLRRFWIPNQPVVYIGTSNVSIGSRLAAFHRTPLGDRKPYAGGYWLKTLSDPGQLRVWWAETEAVEEYEDALLEAFAQGIGDSATALLPDPTIVLPFANLQAADGRRKPHGLQGALLVDETGPVTDEERRAAAARAGRRGSGTGGSGGSDPTRSTGILRSRTALRGAGTATRRAAGSAASGGTGRTAGGGSSATRPARAPRATASSRAPKAPTRLSAEGLAALRAELDELTTVQRPAILARIVAARELGDLRENSDYHEARREQSFGEGRIRAIEELLRHVEIVEEGAENGRARLGSTIVLEASTGELETYALVSTTEANPAAGKISTGSPIGSALVDGRVGDEVEVVIPSGRLRYRILEVR